MVLEPGLFVCLLVPLVGCMDMGVGVGESNVG